MFNFSFNYSQNYSSTANNTNLRQGYNNSDSFLYNMINNSQNVFGNFTENISNSFSNVVNESFNQEQQREPNNPTREIIIDKLKTVKLNEIEEKDCPICLDEYNCQSQIILLPCLHSFHSSCIKKWLSKNVTCPICRKDINKENPKYPKSGYKRKTSKKINIKGLEFIEIPKESEIGIKLKVRYKNIFLERKFANNTQIKIIQVWIAQKIKKDYNKIKLMLNYPKKILNIRMTLEEEKIYEDSLLYVYE
jgi:hypothetical protein